MRLIWRWWCGWKFQSMSYWMKDIDWTSPFRGFPRLRHSRFPYPCVGVSRVKIDWLNFQANTVEHTSLKKRILHSYLCVKMCISNLILLLELYMFVYEYSYIFTLVVYSFAVIHIVRRTFTPTLNFQTQDNQAACWFLEYLDQAPFWWWRGPQGGWISTFLRSRVSKV